MSEERFDRIDQALARLETGQVHLQIRLDGIDQRLGGVDRRLGGVDQRIGELDRHMHVLHEEVLDRIATVPDHMSRLQVKLDEIAAGVGAQQW